MWTEVQNGVEAHAHCCNHETLHAELVLRCIHSGRDIQRWKSTRAVHADLREFTQHIEVNKDRVKEWPSDELEVYAEHPSLFYDMMSKPMISQVSL